MTLKTLVTLLLFGGFGLRDKLVVGRISRRFGMLNPGLGWRALPGRARRPGSR